MQIWQVSKLKREITDHLDEVRSNLTEEQFLRGLPGKIIFLLLDRELQGERGWPVDG